MTASRFKSNLRFALRKETPEMRKEIPLNPCEKIGDLLAWIVYEFKTVLLTIIYNPLFLTVYFTLCAMIITALFFYPIITWSYLSKTWEWTFGKIDFKYVRFILWLLSEVTIFGIGIRAFGRFLNRKLTEHYNIDGHSDL